jgi:MFS transporter, FSR family, fosmidomycin resistance protein
MRHSALGLLIGSHVVDDFYQGAVPAILPFLVAERHYSYAAATGITLAATFLSSLLQPAFGVLTDRHQMRWLIGVGLLTAGLGIGLCGLGDDYMLTWAMVAISGVGVAAYHPEASRLARQAAGASAQGMSWFAVGGNVGIAIAPIIVAPTLAMVSLARTPLLALPAVALALLLAVLWSPRGRPASARPAGQVATAPTGHPARRDDWRSFKWLAVVVMARSITYFGIASFLVLYLIHRFDVSKQLGSAALTAFTGIGAFGTVLGGWLADRFGRVPTVRAGYALVIPGLLGLLLAPQLPAAFASVMVLGLGLYIPFSVHTTLGQEYLPNRIGTASGVTLGLAVSVGGVFVPLLGILADAHGITTALTALLVLPVASLAVSTHLPDTRPHRQMSAPADSGMPRA